MRHRLSHKRRHLLAHEHNHPGLGLPDPRQHARHLHAVADLDLLGVSA